MEIYKTITLHANGELVLCPVKALTAIVKRFLSISDSIIDSPVNLVWFNNESKEISTTLILSDLWSTVKLMGKKVLYYLAEDIGIHSLRSDCAMALHLADLPEYVECNFSTRYQPQLNLSFLNLARSNLSGCASLYGVGGPSCVPRMRINT